MDINTEIFWLSFTSMSFAFAGLCVRYCYKLRCSSVDCCGVHVQRDILMEDIEALNRYRRRIENNDETTTIHTERTRQAYNQMQSGNYQYVNSPSNGQLNNANLNVVNGLANGGMPVINIHGAEQV